MKQIRVLVSTGKIKRLSEIKPRDIIVGVRMKGGMIVSPFLRKIHGPLFTVQPGKEIEMINDFNGRENTRILKEAKVNIAISPHEYIPALRELKEIVKDFWKIIEVRKRLKEDEIPEDSILMSSTINLPNNKVYTYTYSTAFPIRVGVLSYLHSYPNMEKYILTVLDTNENLV